LNHSQNSLASALITRRTQKLSLSASYRLALGVAKINLGEDGALPRLQAITNGMLRILEDEGREKDTNGLEPAYHNRQHIADAVLSMGYFLGQSPDLYPYEKQLLLLVMLVHDFGHRGIANKLPHISHEDESLELLKATPLKDLSQADIFFIEECILATKPENISQVSKAFANDPMDSFGFMRALVNDADIAASFVEPLGLELSKLILLEKGAVNPSKKEVLEAFSVFKQHAQITTPVARKLLGLDLKN
jgi:hypothetical protein